MCFRFKDAAFYFFTLSTDPTIERITSELQVAKADIYFAYSSIHAFVTDPFTTHQPEILFQMAR